MKACSVSLSLSRTLSLPKGRDLYNLSSFLAIAKKPALFFAAGQRLFNGAKPATRLLFSAIVACLAATGCMHSHVIQVTVTNTSNEKISNIVIDYPEATFGINSLEPGKSFQYKIKPTGIGAIKIEFLNSHAVDHVSAGPTVHKNDEGSIEIKLTQNSATSEAKLN